MENIIYTDESGNRYSVPIVGVANCTPEFEARLAAKYPKPAESSTAEKLERRKRAARKRKRRNKQSAKAEGISPEFWECTCPEGENIRPAAVMVCDHCGCRQTYSPYARAADVAKIYGGLM